MDWCRFTGIERYAQERHIVVVMPSAENSSYINMERGECFLDYIGEELPDFISNMFPVSRERDHTWIAGLSMGGYGAWRVALAYPERFGFAASLSGALEISELQNGDIAHIAKMPLAYRKAVFEHPERIRGSSNDLIVLLSLLKAQKKLLPKLYMSVGTEDFIYPSNEHFYRQLKDLGISVSYEKYHGVHNWEFWDAHIRDVLEWLMTKNIE